jgi:hypothetical protein
MLQQFYPPAEYGDKQISPQLYPLRIKIRQPPIGVKMHLVKEHGMFIFEEGPTTIYGLACTHPGSGGVVIYDGLPDESGFFPDVTPFHEFVPENPTPDQIKAAQEAYQEAFYNRNGRDVYYANPAVMGMWFFNGGLINGFTLVSRSDHPATAPIITLTWQPERKRG